MILRAGPLRDRVILALADAPRPSVSDLARELGASRPAVSRALWALAAAGAARREPAGWRLVEEEHAARVRARHAGLRRGAVARYGRARAGVRAAAAALAAVSRRRAALAPFVSR